MSILRVRFPQEVTRMDGLAPEHIVEFMSECYSGIGLQHLMQTAYKYFHNPCALYDMSYKTILTVGEGDPDDQIWAETVRDGFLSEKTIGHFIEEKLLSPQLTILYPCYEPTVFDPAPRIARRLGVALSAERKALSGWFVLFEFEKVFTEEDRELSTWAAKVLAPELEAHLSQKTFSLGGVSNLMLNMLNGTENPEIIEERLHILDWAMPVGARIMALRADEGRVQEPIREYIEKQISDRDKMTVSLEYNGYYMLIFRVTDVLAESGIYAELKEVLEKFKLFAGVSAAIRSIRMLRQYSMQAINCIRVGKNKRTEERISFFEDHTIDILLLTASSYFDISEYVHPFLKVIRDYDRENNTDYLETLRAYVFSSGNLTEAAGRLWIHRNTMGYRMERILGILGLTAMTPKLLVELQISFDLLDILLLNTPQP